MDHGGLVVSCSNDKESFTNLTAIDPPKTLLREDSFCLDGDNTLIIGIAGTHRPFRVRPFVSGDSLTDRFYQLKDPQDRTLSLETSIKGIAFIVKDLGELVKVSVTTAFLQLSKIESPNMIDPHDVSIQVARNIVIKTLSLLSKQSWHPGKFSKIAEMIGENYPDRISGVSDFVGATNILVNGIVGHVFEKEGVRGIFEDSTFQPSTSEKAVNIALKQHKREGGLFVPGFEEFRDGGSIYTGKPRGMMPHGLHAYAPISCPVKDPESWLNIEQLVRLITGDTHMMLGSDESVRTGCYQLNAMPKRKNREHIQLRHRTRRR